MKDLKSKLAHVSEIGEYKCILPRKGLQSWQM